MRGLLFIPILIGALVVAHWFMNQENLQGSIPGNLFGKGAFFSQEKAPVREVAANEPGVNFSGLWMDAKTSAMLKLKQVKGNLTGVYAPVGDRALVYQFRGKIEGDTARFDLKMRGDVYHCVLESEGDGVVLHAQRDMGVMLSNYSQDGRMANGALVISPRSAEQRAEDRARLQKKREEIKKAAANPVVLGNFERIAE